MVESGGVVVTWIELEIFCDKVDKILFIYFTVLLLIYFILKVESIIQVNILVFRIWMINKVKK